jgi:hypothetical protein
LAGQLAVALGPAGKWIFLVGFWAAVFSSLLGVWQSVPYLFVDLVTTRRAAPARPAAPRQGAYRGFLLYLGTVPMVLLWTTLERAQLLYAVFGALFMPLLAVTLLVVNNRTAWVGPGLRNRWVTNTALGATLAFFAWVGWGALRTAVGGLVS